MSEPGSEGYAASKGGIYSLTHALALSLAKQHITVNSISPGWIQTQEYELLRPEDHTQHPSGRWENRKILPGCACFFARKKMISSMVKT